MEMDTGRCIFKYPIIPDLKQSTVVHQHVLVQVLFSGAIGEGGPKLEYLLGRFF